MKVLVPNFEKRGGLVTVVAQDALTSAVLMVAFTNLECYLETLRTGNAVYFSTSRNKRWLKGEESGNIQKVRSVLVDCDGDAIIYAIEAYGPACHTMASSCFYRTFADVDEHLPQAPESGEKEKLSSLDVEVGEDVTMELEYWQKYVKK